MSKEVTGKGLVGCAIVTLRFFVTLPIWYFLIYQILAMVNATTAMWVAYWIYVPTGIMATLMEQAFSKIMVDKS